MTQGYPYSWEQSKCELVGMVERGGSGAEHRAEMGAASFPPSFPLWGWARDILKTSPPPHFPAGLLGQGILHSFSIAES